MSTPLDAPPELPVRFAQHLRAHSRGDTVVLAGEDDLTMIRGGTALSVCRLLDGTRGPGEVAHDARETVPEADTLDLLRRLDQAGLTERTSATDTVDAVDAAVLFRAVARSARPRLDRRRVAVHVLGDAEAGDAVCHALRGVADEVRRTDDEHLSAPSEGVEVGEVQFVVVVVSDLLDPRLGVVDDELRRRGVPWLPVRPRGTRQWIGPLFGTGDDGPCWHCVARRLWSHRRAEEALSETEEPRPIARALPASRATLGLAACSAVLEVEAWFHGVPREVRRGILVHDIRTMSTEVHRVRKRPQCSSCGDVDLMSRWQAEPVGLGPGPEDSLHGTGSGAYDDLVSPVVGVVPTLKTLPGPVPGTVLGRTGATPPARRTPLAMLRVIRRQGNGGTGATEEDARASALGEALERSSGQFHGDELRVRTDRCSLGEAAIDPNLCLLSDPSQARERGRWNAEHGELNQLPPPVDDRPTDWSPLWSLRDGSRRWLPTGMLYYGAPGPSWAQATSNGCAAGPTRDEAIRRGLIELVERDAVALWWYNRTSAPSVPVTDDLRDAYQAIGREVWALDLTSDLGVPVSAAVSGRRRSDGFCDRVMLGFGADIDPAEATRRAFRELAGTMVWAMHDALPHPIPEARRWIDEVDTRIEPWLRPRDASRAPRMELSLDADESELVDLLLQHGLEPLVLDQTRPDVGLPVVRTVVPTLRPMAARFAPGRLFDVPVALGRLTEPTPLASLNPRAVFL